MEETTVNQSFLRSTVSILFSPLLWLGILLGGMGIVGGRFLMVWQRDRQVAPAVVSGSPSPAPLASGSATLAPPTRASVGSVTLATGDAVKLGRDADVPAALKLGETLVDGDTLQSSRSGEIAVLFPNVLDFTMAKESEVGLSNLLPETLVFRQSAGDVRWQILAGHAASIRTTRTLIDVQPGIYRIVYQEPRIFSVLVASGSAQLGMVNAQNVTQVWEVTATQSAVVNETKRTVKIISNVETKADSTTVATPRTP